MTIDSNHPLPLHRPASGAIPATATAGAPAGPRLQRIPAPERALLGPVIDVMRALPDFDHEKVARLRNALAEGRLPCDTSALAGHIQRFHRGQP